VPRVVARATDFQVLLNLVAVGAGVTLVPHLAARWLPPQVRLLAPAEPVTRQVFTVSRRGGDRKPAVRVVLDALALAASAESGYHERRESKEKMSSLPVLSAGS
jgi:DNA-binding transcriptional LysR family regulator